MKKWYSVINDFLKEDRFIIVSNYEIENIVFHSGCYSFSKGGIEKNDVGVWKIKKLN